MAKILLVDDEEDIRELERLLLSPYAEIIEAKNGREAVDLTDETVDLIIMDRMMPKMDGVQAAREIREKYDVPILFLSAKGQEYDKIIGYSAGADDYLVKPFSPQELQLKVQAMLRRYLEYGPRDTGAVQDRIEIRELALNPSTHEVWIRGAEIVLTGKEFEILKLLAGSPGQVFSTQIIYEMVWEEPFFYNSNNTVMTHIKKLRQKLEEDPRNPQYIITVWGAGYKIEK
ncbi:MAG: response regulator transcription factor [Lachnospiraceae bacterium]